MLDHDEGGALLGVDGLEALLQVGQHREVHAPGRLVEEHEARPGHERHRGVEQLLLAIGQAPCPLGGEMPELEERDHLIGRWPQARIGPAQEPRKQAAGRPAEAGTCG
jgi:hypothetical protein